MKLTKEIFKELYVLTEEQEKTEEYSGIYKELAEKQYGPIDDNVLWNEFPEFEIWGLNKNTELYDALVFYHGSEEALLACPNYATTNDKPPYKKPGDYDVDSNAAIFFVPIGDSMDIENQIINGLTIQQFLDKIN